MLDRSGSDGIPLPLGDHVEDVIPHQNGAVVALFGGFFDTIGEMLQRPIPEAINQVMSHYLDGPLVHGGLG
jgi:hypothetical protein